ncbi:hypothetical protein EJ02DRAFT_24965 [Clathrospora elynae]|uniref:Uncharacterized protein n=1 Tax=Clathrospora elynae TaxID=706981 RepID=A0A6A5TA37_9PLEO|nr:hypothetical protein EJ02DRAFT_24965 [Clathrospora elynae]
MAYIHKLHQDALREVVARVSDNDRRDLFRLCLASCLFYCMCIPWIYRHIKIDFSRRIGIVLLHRVCRETSMIATYVRTVTLVNCGKATMEGWQLLYKALSQFTRLEDLSWDSHVVLPGFLMDHVRSLHSRTNLQAKVDQIYATNAIAGT